MDKGSTPVLPQMRPDHPSGTEMVLTFPDAATQPDSVDGIAALEDTRAGQTVYAQLFLL